MIVVIIAGGAGTRLWPLSTPEYPKHLLKINGSKKSLLQSTYDRAKTLTGNIYVVSDVSHAHHVQEQLPDVKGDHFLTEPARRGTASCIIAALGKVAESNDPNETIVFLHADHYIRDVAGFTHSIKVADQIARSQERIVLIGIEPDHPATGFGYIEKGDLFSDESFAYNVKSFKEKPDFDTASAYYKSGNYLWNCGYFVGSANTFTATMKKYAGDLYAEYQKLAAATPAEHNKVYLGLENIAIDYALIEKVPDLLVVPATFDWMDLGSYGDLHKAVGGDHKGNHVQGNVETEELENSLVHNYENKPVAVIGLDNVVIINTPHGILVARKDMAQKVGDISKRLK